jgi:hypothetical protein
VIFLLRVQVSFCAGASLSDHGFGQDEMSDIYDYMNLGIYKNPKLPIKKQHQQQQQQQQQ